MIVELIGLLWLLLAAITSVYSLRVTYKEWGYNKTIPTEIICERTKRIEIRSAGSRPYAVLSDEHTSRTEAIWSPGGVAHARSRLTERRRRINKPAAESGTRSRHD